MHSSCISLREQSSTDKTVPYILFFFFHFLLFLFLIFFSSFSFFFLLFTFRLFLPKNSKMHKKILKILTHSKASLLYFFYSVYSWHWLIILFSFFFFFFFFFFFWCPLCWGWLTTGLLPGWSRVDRSRDWQQLSRQYIVRSLSWLGIIYTLANLIEGRA